MRLTLRARFPRTIAAVLALFVLMTVIDARLSALVNAPEERPVEGSKFVDPGLQGLAQNTNNCREASTLQDKTGWELATGKYAARQDGETVTLRAGDCAHLPAFYSHDEIEFAPDFEVVEIVAPAEVKTITGRDTPLPQRAARPGRISTFAASYDGPDAFKVGEGPRRFLAYRDAAATDATGRRVNINIVRNSKAGDSSTGWHYHTLACQFVFVLKGWSRVEVEGQGEFTVRQGDSMTIPYKMKHDVTGFSADFTVLELNIPADYETIACDPPGRQAA